MVFMMTSSNGNIFRDTGHLCKEFLVQRSVTRSFDVFFDLLLDISLNKPSSGWWFEMPSYPLWRHCNAKSRRTSPCALKWLWIETSWPGGQLHLMYYSLPEAVRVQLKYIPAHFTNFIICNVIRCEHVTVAIQTVISTQITDWEISEASC